MNTKNEAEQAQRARRGRPTSNRLAGIRDSEQESLRRLAEELFGICSDTVRRFGAAPGKGPAASRPLARSAYARQLLQDAGTVAMLHTRWQRESQYRDEHGNPKTIAATGPTPSFEALCRECGLHTDTHRLLEMACQFGLCRRVAPNRLRYGSDVLLLTGQRTLMLARAVVTVERFLATCVHNAEPGRKRADSLGDRTTEVWLSETQFHALSKSIRRHLSNFIESTDRQLLARAPPQTRRSRNPRLRKMCGVTAFAFRD